MNEYIMQRSRSEYSSSSCTAGVGVYPSVLFLVGAWTFQMRAGLLSLLVAHACGHPESDLDGISSSQLPDLTGTWETREVDKNETRVLSLFRHQPAAAAAAAPNSVYSCTIDDIACGHCWLVPMYDYSSRNLQKVEVQCDDGTLGFVVAGTDGSLDVILNSSRWFHQSTVPRAHNTTIHTVHMVYMNHYDVGYTGFVNDVDNKYMHNYFPLAASTAKEMKANRSDGGDRFIYTTHAWLMQRFLECPCPQPPPTPPCVDGLPGVWSSSDGRARYHFSADRPGHVAVRCLTSDWESTPAGTCNWNTGMCSLTASRIVCELDNGKTMAGVVSDDDASISFPKPDTAWSKFTGPLSGLWYGCKRVVNGPNDPYQYLVIAQNASTDNVSVWWDTGVPPSGSSPAPQWTHSTSGFLTKKGNITSLELQLKGYSPHLTGIVTSAYDAIQFPSNDESGLWYPHAAQCYPGPGCPKGEAGPRDCPARTLMNNRTRPVQCPTAEEVMTFEVAVHDGDIVWHAGPFNWQPENMSPQLFEAGIDMVRRMDRRFYGEVKNTTTMSVRDVICKSSELLAY